MIATFQAIDTSSIFLPPVFYQRSLPRPDACNTPCVVIPAQTRIQSKNASGI